MSFPFSSFSASLWNSVSRKDFIIPFVSRLAGYTVLSVRGYEMKPFMYRLSAIRMALDAVIPTLLAALKNSVVLNGVGTRSVLVPSFTVFTVPVSPSFASVSFASFSSRKRPFACFVKNSSPFATVA